MMEGQKESIARMQTSCQKLPQTQKRWLSVRGQLINRNDLYPFACVEMVITPALPVSLKCHLSISTTMLRVGNITICSCYLNILSCNITS